MYTYWHWIQTATEDVCFYQTVSLKEKKNKRSLKESLKIHSYFIYFFYSCILKCQYTNINCSHARVSTREGKKREYGNWKCVLLTLRWGSSLSLIGEQRVEKRCKQWWLDQKASGNEQVRKMVFLKLRPILGQILIA